MFDALQTPQKLINITNAPNKLEKKNKLQNRL